MPDLPDLTPHDEKLILALLDADMSIAAVSRSEQTTLTALLRWSWQPHIRAWLTVLSDLGSLRAKALAANHSAAAVRTLLSATHLADADFYEQADPRDRIRSFESGRKAAAQLLRLAHCSDPAPSRDTPKPHPRPASARRGVRGPARTERGVPVAEPAPPFPSVASSLRRSVASRPLTFDGRLRQRRPRKPRRAEAVPRPGPPMPNSKPYMLPARTQPKPLKIRLDCVRRNQ